MPVPDEPDEPAGATPPPVVVDAPTEKPSPRTITGSGHSVALRGRIPTAAVARGTDHPPMSRVPTPPHSVAIGFGTGAAPGIVVDIDGDRVTLVFAGGRVTGSRAQARDLIDALLEALTH